MLLHIIYIMHHLFHSFKLSHYNNYKSYLRECEANNVINSLNCDVFDIGSRCSLNFPDLITLPPECFIRFIKRFIRSSNIIVYRVKHQILSFHGDFSTT